MGVLLSRGTLSKRKWREMPSRFVTLPASSKIDIYTEIEDLPKKKERERPDILILYNQ